MAKTLKNRAFIPCFTINLCLSVCLINYELLRGHLHYLSILTATFPVVIVADDVIILLYAKLFLRRYFNERCRKIY